jgi:hypothetical protein
VVLYSSFRCLELVVWLGLRSLVGERAGLSLRSLVGERAGLSLRSLVGERARAWSEPVWRDKVEDGFQLGTEFEERREGVCCCRVAIYARSPIIIFYRSVLDSLE